MLTCDKPWPVESVTWPSMVAEGVCADAIPKGKLKIKSSNLWICIAAIFGLSKAFNLLQSDLSIQLLANLAHLRAVKSFF
jgi:hypothetical protein